MSKPAMGKPTTEGAAGAARDLPRTTGVERGLHAICMALAYAGGGLFLALIAMSLVSIIGRKLGFGSVTGDIELMQAGTAVAAAAFLPYCTLMGEHLKVEFFTENLRPGVKRRVDGIADLLLGLVAALVTWRTGLSALSLHEYGDVTPLVSLPLWIPVALLVPSLALTACCGLYRAASAFLRCAGDVPQPHHAAMEIAE